MADSRKGGRTPHTIGRPLAALLASTLLCLLVLECGARLLAWRKEGASFADAMTAPARKRPGEPVRLRDIVRPSRHPEIVYELVPGLQAVFHGHPLRTNDDGFRGPALAHPRSHAVRRIVGLGDSVMFGWGVAEDESYLRRVEAALNHSGGDWQVINTAVPGYNTVMEVATLREKALSFEPELVILGLIPNDVGLPNFLLTPPAYLDLGRSFLWNQLRTGADRLARLRAAPRAAHDRHFEDEPSRIDRAYRHLAGRENLRAALERLQALRTHHGFEVLLVTFDLILYAPAEGRSPAAALALAFARAHGWRVVEPEGRFQRALEERGARAYPGSALALSVRDPHPSALGHALLAEAILDALPPPRWRRSGAPSAQPPPAGATASRNAAMRAK